MRIWDIPVERLCNKHLLGQHLELHAIWTVLIENRRGYSRHPETIRWKGKLKALYKVHEDIVGEMLRRGFNHNSPLNLKFARGKGFQNEHITSLKDQVAILKSKKCRCEIDDLI
jgi:hypothetical protein